MRNKSLILMTICAALSTGLSAQSIYPGQHAGKMKKSDNSADTGREFRLKRRAFITKPFSRQYDA